MPTEPEGQQRPDAAAEGTWTGVDNQVQCDEICLLMKQFIDGADTSLPTANRLEIAMDEMFSDDAYLQEVVIDLAQYRPGGGEFLYDTPEMQSILVRAFAYLSRLQGQQKEDGRS